MKPSQEKTVQTIVRQITDLLNQHISNSEKTAIESFVFDEKKTQQEVKFNIAADSTIVDYSGVKTTLKYRSTFKIPCNILR